MVKETVQSLRGLISSYRWTRYTQPCYFRLTLDQQLSYLLTDWLVLSLLIYKQYDHQLCKLIPCEAPILWALWNAPNGHKWWSGGASITIFELYALQLWEVDCLFPLSVGGNVSCVCKQEAKMAVQNHQLPLNLISCSYNWCCIQNKVIHKLFYNDKRNCKEITSSCHF